MLNPIILFISLFLLNIAGSASAEQPSLPGPGETLLGSGQASGYTFCDKKSGMCMLKANLSMMKTMTTFSDFDLCKYEPKEKKWYWMPFNAVVKKIIAPEQRQMYSAETDPVVRLLTDVTGLFWLTWRENGRPVGRFVFSGMLCEDVMIGPERKGDLIATCIPEKDTATAAYVPDPEIYCRNGKLPGKGVQGHGR